MPNQALNPNEVTEVSEEMNRIAQRYGLEGYAFIAIRGGNASTVSHVSAQGLFSAFGPFIAKTFMEKMGGFGKG